MLAFVIDGIHSLCQSVMKMDDAEESLSTLFRPQVFRNRDRDRDISFRVGDLFLLIGSDGLIKVHIKIDRCGIAFRHTLCNDILLIFRYCRGNIRCLQLNGNVLAILYTVHVVCI